LFFVEGVFELWNKHFGSP